MWFHLCPFFCRCRRSPPCGDFCPWGAARHPAADHRGVWEAVASLKTFLPSPGGTAHSVQHSPHLRGGLVNQGTGAFLSKRMDKQTHIHIYKCKHICTGVIYDNGLSHSDVSLNIIFFWFVGNLLNKSLPQVSELFFPQRRE